MFSLKTRFLIAGMAPAHLSSNVQSSGPLSMSGQMGMQQTSSALRVCHMGQNIDHCIFYDVFILL